MGRKRKHTEEITGGYPRQIFVDQNIKDVACVFCQGLPRNAKQCSNGCLFCSSCVNAAMQTGLGTVLSRPVKMNLNPTNYTGHGSCPLCQTTLNDQLGTNHFFNQWLASRRVQCVPCLKNDTNQWIGPLEDLEAHRAKCRWESRANDMWEDNVQFSEEEGDKVKGNERIEEQGDQEIRVEKDVDDSTDTLDSLTLLRHLINESIPLIKKQRKELDEVRKDLKKAQRERDSLLIQSYSYIQSATSRHVLPESTPLDIKTITASLHRISSSERRRVFSSQGALLDPQVTLGSAPQQPSPAPDQHPSPHQAQSEAPVTTGPPSHNPPLPHKCPYESCGKSYTFR